MPAVRSFSSCFLVAALTAPVTAQTPPARLPERAVRRDVPITNTIRRAFLAGTRDSTGRPGRNYWSLRTDYAIDARLDPATSRITGRESIRIQNNSPDRLTQIGLRLDMNHFLFNVPRSAPWVPSEETDGFVITRMAVNGQAVNLSAPAGRGAPPLSEPTVTGLRTTSARVNLTAPIEPHATATLEIEWNHKVPGAPGNFNHRMSQRFGDTLYQPTQWYPRVAVYDDLRGWDSELYLGPSEFYNNFGRFDVRIDVPAGWIVRGTGVLQNPEQVLTAAARERLSHVLESDSVRTIVGPGEIGPGQATAAGAPSPTESGNRLVWHFVADTVNDFAWATAKKYVWQATRATIPGKGPVPIHMVFLPGRANLYANAGPIARHALEFYSKLWFPYEFPQLTLQDGPSAGMEYPMVINANQGAADHETFHQWAPMTVSNNETWYGWMDEGFNQYANILSALDRGQVGPTLNVAQRYGATSGNEAEPPMMWNANYGGPQFYSFTTYGKTPLMLSMLGGVVAGGDTAVQRAQSEWGKAWRFKHPSPWDYMFFMNGALKQDLGWFWYYWLFTTESVDGSIQNVESKGARTTVTVRQSGQMPSPVVLKVQFAPGGPAIRPMLNSRVTGDTAIVTYPVDVWFAGSRTFKAELNFGGRKIDKITLDPFCRFPDRDPTDNLWPRETAGAPATSPRCS
jgi:hypothetical protein